MTQQPTAYNPKWKRNFMLGGAVAGAIIGAATALLMARAAEEDGDGPPQINTMDVIRVASTVIGTVRGVAALGKRV